ncbi:MAG: ATP-binding protein [Ignavibacteriae bacterium]|nr:ATP-binding protein [Ignavibacteriota bacterium]
MPKAPRSIFRITLRSVPKSVMRVEGYLNKINAVVGLDEIAMHKLMVSLTEAVNNAILHGNASDPTKRVKVSCEVLPGWLLFQINDEGKGFRADHIRNPLKEENLHRASGRGVFLMRTLMDKVEFTHAPEGMQVRLWLNTNK